MVSGIPLLWGRGTRTQDPYVYVAFWAPRLRAQTRGAHDLLWAKSLVQSVEKTASAQASRILPKQT